MKLFLLIIFSGFTCLSAYAQHNLYNWQVKGYTGIANYYNSNKKTIDYLKPEDNLWHRLEIGRSLGQTFGFSASASFGKIRGLGPQATYFTTEARMTSLRLYFYTDNGWLLKPSALVSPFFFGGYGLSSVKDATKDSNYRQVLPFGLGFKVRLTERWQLDLQTEAVYNTNSPLNALTAEQNKYNNGFLHTGLALAYNFGFKSSTFKASRFYASFQGPLAQADSTQPTTATNLSNLNTRPTPLASPTVRTVNPKLIVIRDTVLVTENNKQRIIDTLGRQSVTRQNPNTLLHKADKSRAITRKNLISKDTMRTTTQEREIIDRENALAADDLQTRRAATLRQAETARAQEPLRSSGPYRATPATTRIYSPAPSRYNNNRTPLNRARQNSLVLIDKDKNELEEANRKNRQLQYAFDSLQTVLSQDTVLKMHLRQQNSSFSTLNNKIMRYMQQQAVLNESMQQRLAAYENELTRSQQADSATTLTVPEVTNRFDTTVFFNKNSYEIPSQDFDNLLACAAWLKANPEQKIQLTGYADKSGKADYNLTLSRKRVEAVADFFRFRGVEKERILMQYFGETNSAEPLISLDRKVILNFIN